MICHGVPGARRRHFSDSSASATSPVLVEGPPTVTTHAGLAPPAPSLTSMVVFTGDAPAPDVAQQSMNEQILGFLRNNAVQMEDLKRSFTGLERKVDSLERKVDGLERKVDGVERKVDTLNRTVVKRADVKRLLNHAAARRAIAQMCKVM
jgi:hypothetical protein